MNFFRPRPRLRLFHYPLSFQISLLTLQLVSHHPSPPFTLHPAPQKQDLLLFQLQRSCFCLHLRSFSPRLRHSASLNPLGVRNLD